jgi:serine O-acetyltransferase
VLRTWYPNAAFPIRDRAFHRDHNGHLTPSTGPDWEGLRIHHFGGIIVNSEASIGEYCTLYHGVTLGDLGGWGGSPRVGNRVMIGAGAKLLGDIEISDDCHIGANAVVRTSVPAGCLAVGVPAVMKERVKHAEINHE